MNILSPSILSADFTVLGEEIRTIRDGGAQYLHIDVMDGIFVPAISYGMCVIKSLRKIENIVFDVHLMITEPIRYIEDFKNSGADIITIHLEACKDVKATLAKIRECGCKAGLSIKPKTPAEELLPYMNDVDMILVMSVEPGFGGQKYIESSTEKTRKVRRMIEESGKQIDLEIDGGIHLGNVETVLEAGANVIVAGSSVFGEDTFGKTKQFMDILSK